MAQPAKAVQRALPGVARRPHGEGRLPIEDRQRAGKTELIDLDFVPKTGVARAQVLRDDEQLIGDGGTVTPAQKPRIKRAGDNAAPSALGSKCGDAGALGQAQARHKRRPPQSCVPIAAPRVCNDPASITV